MPMTSWQSLWNLGMAQAQMEAIASALIPTDRSPSGRLQLPSIELQETADTVTVTAFLPGVDPRDVQLRVTPRSLTFYGKRQTEYRSAFIDSLGIGQFQQTIPLPAKVLDRQTQVAYRQGAIVVTLHKAKGFWSGWRSWKHWLGHRLQQFGHQLLNDR